MLRKEKNIAFKAYRSLRRTPTKAFKVKDPLEKSNAVEEEDELSFISRKIHSIWNKKKNTSFKGRRIESTSISDKKDNCKEVPVMCYECKKLGHFRTKCPDLEKSKKKIVFSRNEKKKVLMSTWKTWIFQSSKKKKKKLISILWQTTLNVHQTNLTKK